MNRNARILSLRRRGFSPSQIGDIMRLSVVQVEFHLNALSPLERATNRLSRRAILIDLNPEYLKQQLTRNAQTPLGLTEGDAA